MSERVVKGLAAIACAMRLTSMAAAQEKEAPQTPQMFYVIHEHVKPAMMEQYEKATTEMIEKLTEHQADPEKVRFSTVYGPEMGFTFVIPIDGFAGMDEVRVNWMTVIDAIGKDAWKKLETRASEAVSHRSSLFAVYRADLSYQPDPPRLTEDEVRYINYSFYYATPGREEELEAVAKEYLELYESKKINVGWNVYQAVTGDETPLYVVAQVGRNPADLEKARQEAKEKAGEAVQYLDQRALATIRRLEEKSAWLRPDLSYPTPERAAGAR